MKKYDIIGFGNSVLDITVQVDDNFLKENNIKKSEFLLIDDKIASNFGMLLREKQMIFSPGGSTSNIIAGATLLGASSTFIGGIGNDDFGEEYKKQTLAIGVEDRFIKKNCSTGHGFIFITPDKERSFAINLGQSNYIKEEEITLDFKTKILLIEGYKLESDVDFKTAIKLVKYSKENGAKIALDVNDSGLIKRMGEKLKNFIKEFVDILFMNEIEANTLTGFENEEAVEFIKDNFNCEIVILKLGEEGSIIGTKEKNYIIKIKKSSNLVNTNGAGDAYAAAFLFGLIKNMDFDKIGELASVFSKAVVEQEEARLSTIPHDIKELLN